MRHGEQDALAGVTSNGIGRWFDPHDSQLVSQSLDEIRSLSAREVGPQRYELRGPTKPFSSKIQFSPSTQITLSYAWFSSALEITSTPSRPNYENRFIRQRREIAGIKQASFMQERALGYKA